MQTPQSIQLVIHMTVVKQTTIESQQRQIEAQKREIQRLRAKQQNSQEDAENQEEKIKRDFPNSIPMKRYLESRKQIRRVMKQGRQ